MQQTQPGFGKKKKLQMAVGMHITVLAIIIKINIIKVSVKSRLRYLLISECYESLLWNSTTVIKSNS